MRGRRAQQVCSGPITRQQVVLLRVSSLPSLSLSPLLLLLLSTARRKVENLSGSSPPFFFFLSSYSLFILIIYPFRSSLPFFSLCPEDWDEKREWERQRYVR